MSHSAAERYRHAAAPCLSASDAVQGEWTVDAARCSRSELVHLNSGLVRGGSDGFSEEDLVGDGGRAAESGSDRRSSAGLGAGLSGLGAGANLVAVHVPDPETLVQEQIAYYRARAPEYDDWWLRTGPYESDDAFGRRWEAGKRELEAALRAFSPAGDVLEIAAGTGNLTAALAAVDGVEHITAVDASDEALAIARTKVADTSRVTFLQADVFDWRPPRRFDVVAFGFWLSHVPPRRFESFWRLVADALRPGGRVFFTDNATPVELAASADGRQARTPWSRTWLDRAVSVRTLADGRQFHIVKRAWSPGELEHQLGTLGWSSTVREHQGLFVHGEAARQGAS